MTVTNYIWDDLSDNVLMETDELDATTAVYTYDPSHHGDLTSQHRDGATSYYHYDGQGSTRALTDENEDVTDTYDYTAFGEKIASSGATMNPYRFIGQKGYQYNEETEDYYVRERAYQPNLARFMSRDPLPENGVDILYPAPDLREYWNRQLWEHVYVYVQNNPVNRADPSGLISISKINETVGDCGGWDAKYVFKLDNPATCVGHMFQQVSIYEKIIQCGCEGCPNRPGPKDLKLVEEFWEFFSEIRVGQQDDAILRQLGYSDQGIEPESPNTCGGKRVEREVRFICTADIIASGERPLTWPKGEDSGIPTGKLRSTRDKPKFWGTFQEKGKRTTSDFWNCCK